MSLGSSVKKKRYRKGGKCIISQVLQSPVSSPQVSPKVDASDRPKQAQHLSTGRKVQNGISRVHQGISDSKVIGVINRPVRHLPSHPPKLKVFAVLPRFSGALVHFPPFLPNHGPTGICNDCKGSEDDGPMNTI